MKSVLLCCPRLRTHCPTVTQVGDEIHINVERHDLEDYVESLECGGIKLKLHREQVILLLGVLDLAAT